MDEINTNEFFDIAVKSVVDFKSDMDSKEKEKILESKICKSNGKKNYEETEVEIDGEEKVIQYTEPEGKTDIVNVQIDE